MLIRPSSTVVTVRRLDPPRPSGSTAVMARRVVPPDSLDFFPTPPWATRAFVTGARAAGFFRPAASVVWEPAAGEGHMAEVLREFFPTVRAGDIFDYGRGYEVADFLGPDAGLGWGRPDWIITNPPFSAALAFAERGLELARSGVALLVRLQWLEGAERYRLFERHQPTAVVLYSERVPMTRGRWDPKAKTATAYAWVVWDLAAPAGQTTFHLIPPGSRARFTKADDARRFAAGADAPLLQGGEDD